MSTKFVDILKSSKLAFVLLIYLMTPLQAIAFGYITGDRIVVKGNYFVREDIDFRSSRRDNVVGIIDSKSTFDSVILDSRLLSSGSRAYKIAMSDGRIGWIRHDRKKPQLIQKSKSQATPVATQRNEEVLGYVYVNAHAYQVRTTPDFRRTIVSNRAFTSAKGAVFPVLESRKTQSGKALRIQYRGQKYWIFQSDHNNFVLNCKESGCNDLRLEGNKQEVEAVQMIDEANRSRCDDCKYENHFVAGVDLDEEQNDGEAAPDEKESEDNQCVVRHKDNKPIPKFNRIRSVPERKDRFIQYVLPMALEVQESTGFPASVVIAQALHETAWGTSYAFRTDNSLFGHSCWRKGVRHNFEIDLAQRSVKAQGVCNRSRPRQERGYYMSFSDPRDSVIAYAHNLLKNRSTEGYYGRIRDIVEKVNPPEAAPWEQIVQSLSNYAPGNYSRLIRSAVRSNKLEEYDKMRLCN